MNPGLFTRSSLCSHERVCLALPSCKELGMTVLQTAQREPPAVLRQSHGETGGEWGSDTRDPGSGNPLRECRRPGSPRRVRVPAPCPGRASAQDSQPNGGDRGLGGRCFQQKQWLLFAGRLCCAKSLRAFCVILTTTLEGRNHVPVQGPVTDALGDGSLQTACISPALLRRK